MLYRLLLLMILLIPALASGADSAPKPLTQKDFVIKLMSHFSWNEGLPAKPADRDYLVILGGKRSFRYEAENAYNEQTDLVSLNYSDVYGAYSGKGWIRGISEPTTCNLSFLLPLKGEYLLKAVIKGNGFVWNVDGKTFTSDSKSNVLKEVEIAKLQLKAGVIKFSVTLPAEGAIDSFSLTADDHLPVQPLIGWRFREPMNAARMAEVAVSLSNRFALLADTPVDVPKPLALSETASIPNSVAVSTDTFLGKFKAPSWLRADYRGGTIQVPVKVTHTGYYSIIANAMGTAISGSVNGAVFDVAARPVLAPVVLGVFRLEAGENMLTIKLPPNGGIDTLDFTRKDVSAEEFIKLAGVKGPPERPISAAEADQFLTSLQKTYNIRK